MLCKWLRILGKNTNSHSCKLSCQNFRFFISDNDDDIILFESQMMSEFFLEIASFYPHLHNQCRSDFKSIFLPLNIKMLYRCVIIDYFLLERKFKAAEIVEHQPSDDIKCFNDVAFVCWLLFLSFWKFHTKWDFYEMQILMEKKTFGIIVV